MSIASHVQAVAARRAKLKEMIAEEMAHAFPNFQRITELKKENMRLKEIMLHDFIALKAGADAT